MNHHIVKKGESLWQIAKLHNITLQALIDANPQLEDPNNVMVGEKIFIPMEDWKIPEPPVNNMGNNQVINGEDNNINDKELCRRLAALPRPLIYIVKKGDTLYNISKCFELSLQELLRVNSQIKNPDLIAEGDKIFIPRSKGIYPMPGVPSRPGYGPDHHPDHHHHYVCPYCGRPMPKK